MQRPISSSDSSVDDSGVQGFKAAQAAQFHTSSPPNPTKFKEAQADALRADSIRQTPAKKPRSNSVGQTTPATRTRSTQQTQTPTSAAQLLQLLGSDNKDARQLLHSALAQLDASSRRLAHSDAERRALESAQLAQATQTLQAASAMQQSAVAAQAELSLYRLQMETAQQEILRAQEVVRSLEVQRDDAERAATKARTMARKLHVEKMALLAKEQGRKEGYETGFGHGHVIAVEKERRRNEQRRLETEMRRRQLAPRPPSEPRGAFIEEHIPSGDDETRRNLSRNVSNSQPPPPPAPTQAERRQRRISSDSASIIRPLPPADPPVPVEPPPPPVNNHQPRSQRPPSTASSSSRRVSAPPAVPQQQQQQPPPRVRTASIDGSRTGADSRASRTSVLNVVDPVPNDNTFNRSNSASTQRPRRNSAASRQSMPTPAPHIPAPNIHTRNVQEHHQRRPSTVRSASTSTFDSDPVGAGTGVSTGAGVRSTRRPSLVEAMMPRVIPMPPPPMHLPVPTSVSASTSTSGLGLGSTQPRVQMPEPITMPAHVPMPRPPPGAIPAQAFPPSPAGQTFEVERPRQQQQQQQQRPRSRSPSSVSTSLRTLRLTSFPVTGTAGPGSDRAGSERAEFAPGAPGSSGWGAGGMGGVGAGGGVGRERELSVILEHATEGSPGGSQLGNGNGSGWGAPAPPRQQTPWTRGSSPYSDPRGMEEWRRGTDEEAPRNQLPPPSPVTSPGMLSPYPPIQPPRNNVHGHPSQESLQSSTGSTVNITIVPPSRPQSIALSGPPDGPASARHLSPNHAHDTPVVPEEEEDDEDDDDDDYDEDEDDENGGPPRGFVPTNLNPLPVFAQGVQSHPPPGFVVQGVMPLPVGSQQMGARPQHHHQQQQQQPLQNRSAPATWTAPPLIGANSMEPVRPPSRQMGGVLGNPNAGADANANPIWAAPPLMGANVMGPPPPRPLSRQGGGPGNPATPGGAWGAAPPLTVEHPRPLSRQQHGGPVNPVGAGAWGAAPPLTVEHPRPLSRQGNPAGGWGAPPALTTEPARPLSRQGHGGPAVGAWGTAPPLTTEPSRPPSRQMGGVLGNPAATTWAAPPVMGANAMGPPQQHGPPGQLAAAPPPGGWSFAGPYTFGTPSTQPPPLGFPAPSASNAPHSPQPTRPQSFTGDAAMGATTPRPIYGPPINPAFGTGYPSQTPGIAAGYPLPASVSNSSPATTVTTSHQRVNAGTTPGFVPRALSRPASRASSGGFTRYNNNQTPNPNSNLGITNPYTSIVEEGEGGGSGSSGSSTSSLGLPRMTSIDRMTANNTAVNASGGYLGGPAIYAAGPVIPVIPPSPANSHQPLRR